MAVRRCKKIDLRRISKATGGELLLAVLQWCISVVICIGSWQSVCKIRQSVRVAAQMISTMANLEGEETFEASFLGQAEEVVQERICDDELILIKGYDLQKSFTVCCSVKCCVF